MAEARIRGVRLTREERLAVRRLISGGCSFEEAAAAVRCSTKTVQRLLNTVGECHHGSRRVRSGTCHWLSAKKSREDWEAAHRIGRSHDAWDGPRPRSLVRFTAMAALAGIGRVARTRRPTREPDDRKPRSSANVLGSALRWNRC